MASKAYDYNDLALDEEYNKDYCDEAHIEAFARALTAEEYDDVPGLSSPSDSASTLTRPHRRIRKISAMSDFAPIHQKVQKRRKGGKSVTKRYDWLYHAVRWPLLFLLFLVIGLEFGCYVLTRQFVNVIEWTLAWRGKKGVLRKRLRSARSWKEWKEAAKVMDDYLEFDVWKATDEDPFYDWALVKKVRRSLKSLREKNDVRGVLGVLEVCVRSNFAGTESSRLYSETFIGTKDLIESYVTEVESALSYIRKSTELSIEEKRRFFKTTNRNFGASALCFSGGASFGFYHFGVLKALLDAKLLPRVYNGTSAGGLAAGFACCYTEEEMRRLLTPRLADKITSFDESLRTTMRRLRTTGAMFDTVAWAKKCQWFTRGSLTFREAYERTGRVLNVSVVPSDVHSPTKLLNYLTGPDCIIWSALLASAAVPGIINPVVLMQKTRGGDIIPWSWGSKFKDGSLRVDVPLQSLNLLFNVNHPIVSQVNPHVHLFFFGNRGSAGKPVAHAKGKGWRGGFLLSAAEQFLKLELTKNFKVIRDLELLPQLLGSDWSSVWLQRFDGSVTIWPRSRVKDWFRILTDPDRQELDRMIRVGELATWPKLHLIENRFRIEHQIFRGRQAVRQALLAKEKDRPTSDVDAGLPSAAAHAGPSSNETSVKVPWPALSVSHLPIESDAERSFASGAQKFFKKGHHGKHDKARSEPTKSEDTGGSPTPEDIGKSEDPLVSPKKRKKWASNVLRKESGDAEESGQVAEAGAPVSSTRSNKAGRSGLASMFTAPQVNAQGLEVPAPSASSSQPQEGRPTPTRSSSFLSRIREASFSSPFATFRSHKTSTSRARSPFSFRDRPEDGEEWSSDSLSEDELPWSVAPNGRPYSNSMSSFSLGVDLHGEPGAASEWVRDGGLDEADLPQQDDV